MARASAPSTQSVATTTTNSTSPARVVSGSTISATNTGISAMRRKEMTFGIVRMRSVWAGSLMARRTYHHVGPAGFEPATS